MSLADWVSGALSPATATPATPATPATVHAIKGPSVAAVAAVAVANPQTNALDLIKASNTRMATHRGQRIIAVASDRDGPELRQALAVLGYGNCTVLHLDTAPLRGKSSAAISEAIEAAETGGEL